MEWAPLPGGWSGESFLTGIGEERSVVRIYARPSARGVYAAQVDAALMRLVRGLVPTPEVVELRPAAEGSPALLVTRYVPGPRADDVVRDAGPDVLAEVGGRLGRLAGTLAGVATLKAGEFVDEDLRIEPFPQVRQDLPALVEDRLDRLRGLDDVARESLRDLAHDAQQLLDEVGRTALVHGDLTAKNVVLGAGGEVAALVDWEHAHSGHPHADLGSLLRFDRHPAWEEAVLSGWSAVRDEDPGVARDRARCADLLALVDLAARPGGNLVVDLAEVFLAEVVRTGDVHAHP
ncbi:phosphotransferase family protein [Nocardioides daphniae]|nr:phosphotransferase [Nocardioides daphniae]QCC78668.1 translation initiation factor IF-2 [Nocardioides daphniae]